MSGSFSAILAAILDAPLGEVQCIIDASPLCDTSIFKLLNKRRHLLPFVLKAPWFYILAAGQDATDLMDELKHFARNAYRETQDLESITLLEGLRGVLVDTEMLDELFIPCVNDSATEAQVDQLVAIFFGDGLDANVFLGWVSKKMFDDDKVVFLLKAVRFKTPFMCIALSDVLETMYGSDCLLTQDARARETPPILKALLVGEDATCTICLEETPGMVQYFECRHGLHRMCAATMLVSGMPNMRCPSCRAAPLSAIA